MITLKYGAHTIELGDRLVWSDEFAWSPISQSISYSTTGAMLVDVSTKQGGQPITLDGTRTAAWMTRETCQVIESWKAIPDAELELTLRGTTHSVIFDHSKGGFEAAALHKLADGQETPDQLFLPILRFLKV